MSIAACVYEAQRTIFGKVSKVNTYAEYYGFDELDRRSQLQGNLALGDAIGGMITATVFGLTRAVDELNSNTGRAAAPDGLGLGLPR